MIKAFGFNSSKLILTLLIEVKEFYMELITIYVWRANFQKFISGLLRGGKSSSLQNGLKNPLQIFLSILGDRRCSGRNYSKKKIRA